MSPGPLEAKNGPAPKGNLYTGLPHRRGTEYILDVSYHIQSTHQRSASGSGFCTGGAGWSWAGDDCGRMTLAGLLVGVFLDEAAFSFIVSKLFITLLRSLEGSSC